jgi:hypothetical protein
MTRTVCVDFDGVIHAYSRGWQDGSIYDQPLPGAIEALDLLMDDYAVIVHSTRDPEQIAPWLRERGVACRTDGVPDEREFWNVTGTVLVTRRKYPAVAYIDDRAIRFRNWDQALDDLTRLG